MKTRSSSSPPASESVAPVAVDRPPIGAAPQPALPRSEPAAASIQARFSGTSAKKLSPGGWQSSEVVPEPTPASRDDAALRDEQSGALVAQAEARLRARRAERRGDLDADLVGVRHHRAGGGQAQAGAAQAERGVDAAGRAVADQGGGLPRADLVAGRQQRRRGAGHRLGERDQREVVAETVLVVGMDRDPGQREDAVVGEQDLLVVERQQLVVLQALLAGQVLAADAARRGEEARAADQRAAAAGRREQHAGGGQVGREESVDQVFARRLHQGDLSFARRLRRGDLTFSRGACAALSASAGKRPASGSAGAAARTLRTSAGPGAGASAPPPGVQSKPVTPSVAPTVCG